MLENYNITRWLVVNFGFLSTVNIIIKTIIFFFFFLLSIDFTIFLDNLYTLNQEIWSFDESLLTTEVFKPNMLSWNDIMNPSTPSNSTNVGGSNPGGGPPPSQGPTGGPPPSQGPGNKDQNSGNNNQSSVNDNPSDNQSPGNDNQSPGNNEQSSGDDSPTVNIRKDLTLRAENQWNYVQSYPENHIRRIQGRWKYHYDRFPKDCLILGRELHEELARRVEAAEAAHDNVEGYRVMRQGRITRVLISSSDWTCPTMTPELLRIIRRYE